MSSVGTQLQQARGERRLSLAEVTQGTKIQPWVLEALEGDRLHELMSPIYVKGFLSTYARFLHLEPATLIGQLPRPAPEPDQQPTTSLSGSLPSIVQFPVQLFRRLAMAAAVGGVMAGIVALHPLQHLPALSLRGLHFPKMASIAPIKEPVRPAVLPTLTLLPTQPLEILLSAGRGATWVEVRADGKLISQQRLQRGAKERWTAKKKFELVIAKPSQVELTLNGQPISPFVLAYNGRLLITHYGVVRLANEP